ITRSFRARAEAICSTRVLLPMPGSPERRMTDPGTMPPPSTWSTSSSPLLTRGRRSAVTSPIVVGLRGAEGLDLPKPLETDAISSTNEFQAPHCSHLPIQRAKLVPQVWQTNFVLTLAMATPHYAEQNAYMQAIFSNISPIRRTR